MFTEGLDENAIKWVNQKIDVEIGYPTVRSPLAEKITCEPFPKSPLFVNSGASSLPPLKYSSHLLGAAASTCFTCIDYNDYGDEEEEQENSTASVSCETHGKFSDEEVSGLNVYDEEGSFANSKFKQETRWQPDLKKRLWDKNLRVDVPGNLRRLTDGELGLKKSSTKNFTPVGGARNNSVQRGLHLRYAQGPPTYDSADLGTPSAPPIVDIEQEDEQRSETEMAEGARIMDEQIDVEYSSRRSGNFAGVEEGLADYSMGQNVGTTEFDERQNKTVHEEKEKKTALNYSTCYSTSGQYAWQTLVTYEACIELCLRACEDGCIEAGGFLRDRFIALRSAFGLHKFLLQPQGVKPVEASYFGSIEQICPSKVEKVVGKIKVEVRKVRIIPRRKLKSTYSSQGAAYMQAGAEYIRQVSSLVKNKIHSLKPVSFPEPSEERYSCFVQLAEGEAGSTICLQPGSGEYHVFLPESQVDALVVEVQDSKKAVKGQTRIPISSLSDNPGDRVRWWPIYHEDNECVGKIQLCIGGTMTSDENDHIKNCPVVETLAYDLLLEAAMRAQNFHSRNLKLHGAWHWLLTEFAVYYGVSESYAKLRYLSHIMNVATPTKDCLDIIQDLLLPLLEARSEKKLTRQEKSILLDCENQIECLLANIFRNYKLLDESSPSGMRDVFGQIPSCAAPALSSAVQVYSLLHDILSIDAKNILENYLQTAAEGRCRKHMIETDEFVSVNPEGYVMDSITVSTAYSKMKHLCINLVDEIRADREIDNQNIFPSSIELSNITAAIYSTELSRRLQSFLAAWPPSRPHSHVNELIIASTDFERNLESWTISPVQGGLNSKNLFQKYIVKWVQDMELSLLDLCKAEKVPWCGVTTNHSSAPFAERMYEKIRNNLILYEVVISRWPHYSIILGDAVANVERAIIKALEKQYNDVLIPLKDSIPTRLNMQVQKLARRQSLTIYLVPNQLGIFLNTIKRILDILHGRLEDILKSWASCLPNSGDKKLEEQMNEISVLLRTKYKNYLQAIVGKLVSNMQANRATRLHRVLEETREEDGEAEVRERMQLLNSQLIDSISNLHEVFTSHIFIATCRGLWDRMGQIVLKFLEGRKENRKWYNGSYHSLGILDDTFASQMQRLQGNALEEKDLQPPRSVNEARSMLCKDRTNATDPYLYI